MQQRRSSSGRPSGTDGSDYSYRMVVESRYTKVARRKSRLSRLLLIQGLVALVGMLLILLPLVKGEAPNPLGLSSVVVSFLSLIIGESGRRHSRTTLLKIYLVLSFVAILLSIACSMKSNFLLEVINGSVANSWENNKVQLIEAIHVFIGVLVEIFATITTLSLIHNMSPPKRSS